MGFISGGQKTLSSKLSSTAWMCRRLQIVWTNLMKLQFLAALNILCHEISNCFGKHRIGQFLPHSGFMIRLSGFEKTGTSFIEGSLEKLRESFCHEILPIINTLIIGLSYFLRWFRLSFCKLVWTETLCYASGPGYQSLCLLPLLGTQSCLIYYLTSDC